MQNNYLLEKSKKAYEEGGIILFLKRALRYLCDLIVPNYFDLVIQERAIAYPKDGEWNIISFKSQNRRIPVLSEKVWRTRHASDKHQEIMLQRYTMPGFVDLEKSDIVFDIGAYLGGFTIPASQRSNQVYAIDPNAEISNCLSFNTSSLENVEVLPYAVWNKNKILEINQSFYPNDNSVLAPDQETLDESFEVRAKTISRIAHEIGIDCIDFLKIEAEGVEPEILESALRSGLEISKIVVETSAERDGETTTEKAIELLKKSGYEIKIGSKSDWGEQIVYAKLK